MTTLYFRYIDGDTVNLLFTPETSPIRAIEELMLQEILVHVEQSGVYKSELASEAEGFPRKMNLIKIADHDQSVALVHLQTTESGEVIVENARLEIAQHQQEEVVMKQLASVAAKQAQQLPPNSDEWVLLAL